MSISFNTVNHLYDKFINKIPNYCFYHAERLIQNSTSIACFAYLISISFDGYKQVSLSNRTFTILLMVPCARLISLFYTSLRDMLNQKKPLVSGVTLAGNQSVFPKAPCPFRRYDAFSFKISSLTAEKIIEKKIKFQEKSYPSQMTHENCPILNHTNYSIEFKDHELLQNGNFAIWEFKISNVLIVISGNFNKIEFLNAPDYPNYICVRVRRPSLEFYMFESYEFFYYKIKI